VEILRQAETPSMRGRDGFALAVTLTGGRQHGGGGTSVINMADGRDRR